MSDKEINVTYETLFDLLRREKSREELQDLGETFSQDVVNYLEEKRKILTEDKGTLDTFSVEEKEKTKVQLENIKRILRELYERREKKILSIALYKSREPTTLVDMAVMTGYEKDFFNKTVELLNKYRGDILMSMLYDRPKQQPEQTQENTQPSELNKEPIQETEQTQEIPKEQPKQPIYEQETSKESPHEPSKESPEMTQTQQEQPSQEQQKEPTTNQEKKKIKFIDAVPKFVGRELEVYGPFESSEIIELPLELAKILIDKGRAEEVN